MNHPAIIIIGREPSTGKLQITYDANAIEYGDFNSVPESVLPQHCSIELNGGSMRLRNIDINSYTYVNGQAAESKVISRADRIELGISRYLLDWQAVDTVLPPEADICQLKTIREEYDRQNIKLQIDERRFNSLRSATGLITMLAIALSIVTGRQSAWYLVLYAVAIIVSLAFTVKAYRDSSKVPQLRNELNKKFQHDYRCPKCGRFLGNQPYDILTQNQQCPYCRVKFIH